MSYITRVGNLAETPTLREGEKGPYCFADVIVNDSIKKGDGYVDGPAIRYEVAVNGNEAVNLVEAAEASGNIRIFFSGDYYVTEYVGEKGSYLQHKVRADHVGVSLRGQKVVVQK